MAYDPNIIRSDFPIFKAKQASGIDFAYLDTAASAQKPSCLIQAYQDFYTHYYANIHRGVYTLGHEATEHYEQARQKVANWIGAPHPETCIFTRNTTESINLIAHSFGAHHVMPGDNILITQMEHHANLVPWQVLCHQKQADLNYFSLQPDGTLNLAELEKKVNSRTKLISLVHVSNTLGTINPIEHIIQFAKSKNIPVLIDGAQSIVHLDIDVQKLDCDFFVFSAHKLYGPTGLGVCYAKKPWLQNLPPYQTGGAMITQVSMKTAKYQAPPHKFEAGTPAITEVYAFGKVLDYLSTLDWPAIREYEQRLLAYTEQQLLSQTNLPIRIIGQAPEKTSIISFAIDSIHPHDLGTILDQANVSIRAGHHCTMPIMAYFKIPATARISLGIYNTQQDIDQLIQALKTAQTLFSKSHKK